MESTHHGEPWNKGKLVGQKPPLKPKDIWAIPIQLQNTHQRSRSCHVQPRSRQQASGVRPSQSECSVYHARQQGFGTCDGRAAGRPHIYWGEAGPGGKSPKMNESPIAVITHEKAIWQQWAQRVGSDSR